MQKHPPSGGCFKQLFSNVGQQSNLTCALDSGGQVTLMSCASAGGIDFLGQGTIYPDIVESGTKTAKCVKSHHNVGGLPEDLQFELVEPLKQLFKDEVRACGVELGLPYEIGRAHV